MDDAVSALHIGVAEAARILACEPASVRDLLYDHGHPRTGPLVRSDVEAVALARWRRTHAHGDDTYWVTRAQARQILGVNPARVGQLVHAGLIPFERAGTARRQILFRREQLEVVARARRLRRTKPLTPELL